MVDFLAPTPPRRGRDRAPDAASPRPPSARTTRRAHAWALRRLGAWLDGGGSRTRPWPPVSPSSTTRAGRRGGRLHGGRRGVLPGAPRRRAEPGQGNGRSGPSPVTGAAGIEARGKCGRFGGRTSPPSRWGPIRADCVDRGVAAARGEQWSATIRRRAALAGHLAELSRAGRAPSNASTAVAAARLRPAAPASPARARVSCRLHLGYTGGPPGPARRSRAHLGRIMGT